MKRDNGSSFFSEKYIIFWVYVRNIKNIYKFCLFTWERNKLNRNTDRWRVWMRDLKSDFRLVEMAISSPISDDQETESSVASNVVFESLELRWNVVRKQAEQSHQQRQNHGFVFQTCHGSLLLSNNQNWEKVYFFFFKETWVYIFVSGIFIYRWIWDGFKNSNVKPRTDKCG